jgi:hypothetical protein
MLRGIPTISAETSAKIEKNVDGAKKYTEKAYQLWYNYENKQN